MNSSSQASKKSDADRTVQSLSFFFAGPHSWRLHGRKWRTPQKSLEGTIVLIHGYSEHCGRYGEFVDFLNSKGFDVLGIDLPGHGLSEGRRSNIDDFQDYVRSIEALLEYAQPNSSAPLLLFGHSMGGLVSIRFLQTSPLAKNIQKLSLSSPLLGLDRFTNGQLPFVKLFTILMPNLTLPNSSELNEGDLSHDAELMASRRADPLIRSQVTIHWVREFLKAREAAFAQVADIRTPVGLFQAGEDHVVSRSEAERFFGLLQCPKEIHIYEGFFHEILNEIGRRQVMEDVFRFVAS